MGKKSEEEGERKGGRSHEGRERGKKKVFKWLPSIFTSAGFKGNIMINFGHTEFWSWHNFQGWFLMGNS